MTVSNTEHYNDEVSGSSTDGARKGLTYFLAGAGIGAAVALLFAPKSGADLRGNISELTRKGYDETLELAQQLKEQSADVYQSIKEKTDKVYDLAAERLSLVKDTFEDPSTGSGASSMSETANKTLDSKTPGAEQKPHEKQGGNGGRQSANIA